MYLPRTLHSTRHSISFVFFFFSSSYIFSTISTSTLSRRQLLNIPTTCIIMNSSSTIQIESVVFPPTVKPPTATDALFLGGAGERGLEIKGNFVKFTAIGVYLEEKAVPVLAGKWKGKTAKELIDSVDFYKDIVTGSFEKFAQVTMILPLTGKQYSEKVTENCVAIWKAQGKYTDADEKAIAKFLEVFKDENFPPGSSIFFTIPSCGSLSISFSGTNIVPEVANAVIDNKQLAEAILESMIGEHGVSPAAKQSLASRLSALMNKCS